MSAVRCGLAVCGALCACLAWAYAPSTADIAKVVGDRGGVSGGLGCGTDVMPRKTPFEPM